MDLDNLRQQWQQQPTPDSAAPGESALHALLERPSTSPVAQMVRNARWESITTVFCLVLSVAGVLWSSDPQIRLFWGLGVAIALLMGYYYYYKLRVLGRLSKASGALRTYVESQLHSLRSLLRLNYGFTMMTLVVTMGFLLYSAFRHVPQLFQGDSRTLWQRGVWLGLTVVATWLITHWIVRWYLHYLYGRHLDRLEALVRELGEEK
ncbi:DUF485 domain-containing protein [Hymenobacter elongatus]|uniref:Uncharacterized protein n=1 Tax=Hymenobacter elongatus TaxID=877208 RepID=A0A4Z0PKE4_9BACT|nr:hypothetical protein [Hymenobacter elongatus]TGE15529.1 hypothetical protein E5J99_12060 [Hymenobacter elongatus]